MEDLDDKLYQKGGLLYGYASASWYTLHKKLRALGYGELWDAGDAKTYEWGMVWINHPHAGKVFLGRFDKLSRKSVNTLAKMIEEGVAERYALQEAVTIAWKNQRVLVRHALKARIVQQKQRTADLLERMVRGYKPINKMKKRGVSRQSLVKAHISKILSYMRL